MGLCWVRPRVGAVRSQVCAGVRETIPGVSLALLGALKAWARHTAEICVAPNAYDPFLESQGHGAGIPITHSAGRGCLQPQQHSAAPGAPRSSHRKGCALVLLHTGRCQSLPHVAPALTRRARKAARRTARGWKHRGGFLRGEGVTHSTVGPSMGCLPHTGAAVLQCLPACHRGTDELLRPRACV